MRESAPINMMPVWAASVYMTAARPPETTQHNTEPGCMFELVDFRKNMIVLEESEREKGT
jgi:hypothetical protein